MGAGDELVEWIEPDGSVIEIVTRQRMRDESLRHRCVYIVVRSAGEHGDSILIHKRADWKDIAPGAWDLAFGGVCDPGETWEESAHRELAEEAGLTDCELTDHGDVAFEAPGVALLGRMYSCESDGPFAFNDGEVVATEWVRRQDLDALLAERDTPDDSFAVVLPRVTRWPPPGAAADSAGTDTAAHSGDHCDNKEHG